MRELIKESRTDHIIQHAQDVFFSKGYSMTAISDVCKVAGCSRTTLYSYFDSKENLYIAVVIKALKQFLGHFSQLDLEGKSGLERTLTLSVGYINFTRSAPQHYQLMLDFYSILRSINEDAVLTEAHSKIKACIYFEKVKELAELPFKLLAEEIQKGQEDGTINKSATPMEHMMNIWAYLKGVADISPIFKNIYLDKKQVMNLEQTVTKIIKATLTL